MKAFYLNAACALALTFGIAACVPSTPAPAPAPAPVTRPPPAPVPSASQQVQAVTGDSWMDVPASQGDWTQGLIAGNPFALFGVNSRIPSFAIRCVRANGTITIARRSETQTPRTLSIRTETMSRSIVTEPVQGFPGSFRGVSLRADDPLLDAMALSKGRFAVEMEGEPTLYLPSWAEVSRVIEDCR